MEQKTGIQRKLIWVTLLVGSLPVILGLTLAYQKGKEELQEAIGSNFVGLAQQAADKADLVVSNEVKNLLILAANPELIAMAAWSHKTHSGKNLETLRQELLIQSSEWEQARASGGNQHPILKNPGSSYLSNVTKYDEEPGAIISLFMTDSQGVLLAASNTFPSYFSNDRLSWKKVYAEGQGQTFIGDIYRDEETNLFLFDIGVPIFKPASKEVIGSLIFVADIKKLFKNSIESIRFGKTGHAMLMDGNGTVLVCPILPTGMHVTDPEFLKIFSGANAFWSKVASDAHGGINSIIGVAPVSRINSILEKSGATSWYSFIRQEPSELYAPVQALLVYFSIASVILLSFMTFLSVIVSRKFVKPFRVLTEGAELIGKGNLDHRLEVRTNDEIEQLADEFNRMAEHLQNSHATLEKRVEERTSELNTINTIAITVNQSLDLQKILNDTLSQVMEVMELEAGVIHHWDQSKNRLYLRSHQGLPDDMVRATSEINEGDFISGRVVSQKKIIVIDESKLEDYSQSPMVKGGFKSIIGVPIFSKNHLVATMVIASRSTRHFTPSTIQMLSSIVNQVGTAIENASLYTREKAMVTRLKEVDQFKSEFLSNVSHELRMPLTSIIGFSELLLDRIPGELTPDQDDYIHNMQESGYHLLEIINNLLNLSKLRAGKMEVHYEQFELKPLIENIKRTISPLISKKGLNISATLEGDIPTLFSDEGKIKQILLNLLSNAIKFTPAGGNIELKARPVSLGGHSAAEIVVIDTGIGIRPEDKAKIFDEFQQLDSSFTRDYPGTGLGLTIARQFIGLLGGKISVESQYGHGSTFKIIFPLRSSTQLLEKPVMDTPLPKAVVKTPGSEHPSEEKVSLEEIPVDSADLPRILVVEDDPTVSRLLTLYLTQEGYHVDHAMDGDEAIEKARLLKPFAITLDIMLPRKDGWEVLQRLKQLPETKDVPIIIVSIIENRDLGFSLGATDYFTKPIDRKGLLDSLKRLDLSSRVRRKPVTVLVIDDDIKALQLVSAILETEGYGVLKAQNSQEGINLALEVQPDLILLDLLMPDVSGFETLEKLKEHPTAKNIPVIIFSGRTLTEEDQNRISNKIRGMIHKGGSIRQTLLTEIRKFEKLYPDKAKMVDGLTGFYNERYLQNRLADESNRALRIQRTFSLLLANIDGFKSLNSQFGIELGDHILREVAGVIRDNTRSANPLCRCGGSTIAVILTETKKDTAIQVGEKLRGKVDETVFKLGPKGKDHRLSLSVGIATFFEDGTTPESINMQANWALDQARSQGGDRVVVARNLPILTNKEDPEKP